nr:FAD-binding oxidoreductase [uncultured Sphingomonas sp.]
MASHAPSLYAATANQFPQQSPLAGDTWADVVVVGGGLTGLSTALAAAEAGHKVVLLEAQRIGWGASGRNGGQLIPGLRKGAVELVAMFGEEKARDLLTLANSAGGKVRDLIAHHAIQCDLRDGHFYAAVKPSHLRHMEEEHRLLERLLGYEGGSMVAKGEVADHVATDAYVGGYYDRNGGHIHPLNYALGLAQAAVDAGVHIHEQTAALEMDHGRPVRVKTERGTVYASHGVLACDAFMYSIEPKLARMTMPVANYQVATEVLGHDRIAQMFPSGAAVADSRFVLNYYRPSGDHRLIFSGGEKYTPTPPADIEAFVRPHLESVFPQLRGVGVDFAWGGIVGVTMNRLPQFGRIGNSYYAHGWSGHGLMLTTLAGDMIVQAMHGGAANFDLFASLPAKPFPGGRLLRYPLYVAAMLSFALRDRL